MYSDYVCDPESDLSVQNLMKDVGSASEQASARTEKEVK